jgi:hypothetical protein
MAWWAILGVALIVTGLLERTRLIIYYGSLVLLIGLIFEVGIASGLIPYPLAVLGFGIFVGAGLGLVGWVTHRAIIPLGAYVLLGSVLEYAAPPSMYPFIGVLWLMLMGAAFATAGFLRKSAFEHFTGMAFAFGVAAVYVLGGNLVVLGLVGFIIVGGALVISSLYMLRVLGRAPHVEEILTLAARALFTYGLRKPLDQYRVIAVTVQGDIATELMINQLLTRIEEKWRPIVLLGPTSPTQIVVPRGVKVGWVVSLPGVTGREYTVLQPANPSDVNIFIADEMKQVSGGHLPVLIGDFLDNMIPVMREDAFYKYYSELASRIKLLNHTGVFIIKSDIHPELAVNIVKRFADVIIENREREHRNKVVREVRVSNKVDNFQTDWQPVPRTPYAAS